MYRKTLILFLAQFVFIISPGSKISAQNIIEMKSADVWIQPQPKKMVYSGFTVIVGRKKTVIPVSISGGEELKAAKYLEKVLRDKFTGFFDLLVVEENEDQEINFHLNLQISQSNLTSNDQYYSIDYDQEIKRLKITSPGLLGLLYGVVSFSQCVIQKDDALEIPLFNIIDWPDYRRRIFAAMPRNSDIRTLLDFALQNKMETIAIAQRQYPWYEIGDEYSALLKKINEWKKEFGGPNIMQMHNVYEDQHIVISDEADVQRLITMIDANVEHGINRVMILADDLPPFKFGEGYILTNAKDKKMFKHMAEAHCFLMKKINDHMNSISSDYELHYCPPFYTHEDMYYGDMSQYVGTPWEEEASGPLKRDLNYIGQHLPENIFIIWTGPNVRSRKITEEDIKDWQNNLAGRAPFTWDNTIYSHHPFTSTPLFTAWLNDLPEKYPQLTAGNGMAINGDVNSEEFKVGMMTTNDYMWNTTEYDSERSLKRAIEKRYGFESLLLLLEFRDIELEIRKKIGERDLWFESDTLWKIIRKARWITGKNPLYYHLNYNGLKALRMQLKYSVPEPLPEMEHIAVLKKLESTRSDVLDKLKEIDLSVGEYFESICVKISEKKK